jgi:hypothetical protein
MIGAPFLWGMIYKNKSLDMILPLFRRKVLFLWARSSTHEIPIPDCWASWNCYDTRHNSTNTCVAISFIDLSVGDEKAIKDDCRSSAIQSSPEDV